MKIATVLAMICLLLNLNCANAQDNAQQLIIGTWSSEEDPNIVEVYSTDGIQNVYIDGELYETYYWEIDSGQTPSGLTISHLKLINTQDANDVFVFEINGLNQERLVLVYQRPGGGLGQLTTFLRQ